LEKTVTRRKVGLLGGAFDPVHNGHLALAEAARNAIGLDTVVFIPTGVSATGKPIVASSEDRVAMLRCAIDESRDSVSTTEIDRPGKSFAIDTIGTYREDHPGDEVFFLLGADTFESIATWRNWEEVVQYTNLIVLSRNSQMPDPAKVLGHLVSGFEDGANEDEIRAQSGSVIKVVHAPLPHISSSEIRAAVGAGEACTEWVPEEVSHYMNVHGLYEEQGEP
jgi:nicotinate-nucleotide adenylyltransferase